MSGTASFHPDETRLDVQKKLTHFQPCQLAFYGSSPFSGQSVNLKIVFGEVNAYPDKLLHEACPYIMYSVETYSVL